MELANLRSCFPFFARSPTLIYLDNAATTQIAAPCLEAINRYYQQGAGNTHRSYHKLGNRASRELEGVREQVAHFLNAADPAEIIFTSGTTSSLNLLAASYANYRVQSGEVIWVSIMEHHANFLPWQQLAAKKKAQLKVIPLSQEGNLDLAYFQRMLCSKSKILAITYTSNLLGVKTPIKELIRIAHASGVEVVVDAAQEVAHQPIDVQALGCDFLAFSAHKMYGPTGVGVLYGRKECLERLPPSKFGGGMVGQLEPFGTDYAPIPQKFEAGTLPLASILGLGAAIGFLLSLDRKQISQQEKNLISYAKKQLKKLPGCQLLFEKQEQQSLVSFYFDQLEAVDIAMLLATKGIAIRAGNLCAQPLLKALSLNQVLRLSLGIYNTKEEIEVMIKQLAQITNRLTLLKTTR